MTFTFSHRGSKNVFPTFSGVSTFYTTPEYVKNTSLEPLGLCKKVKNMKISAILPHVK